MTTRFATLDVGTNTVLLLVAEADGVRFVPVVERMEITRLGRGVDSAGQLAPQAIDETVAAIVKFAAEARELGAQGIACVATSASRDAHNGDVFRERVQREAGLTLEIIAGDLEARLSYEAAARDLGKHAPVVVLDIGGGSTELVYGEDGRVTFKQSFDVGSVRLTERFAQGDPPTAATRAAMTQRLDEAFASLPVPPEGFALVGVAGTVTTVYAVAHAVDPWDPEKVHLSRMSATEVRAECDRYFQLTLAQRRQLKGMPEKRADVICAGSLILERAMARLGAREVVVSDRGLRWGLLYHRFGGCLKLESWGQGYSV